MIRPIDKYERYKTLTALANALKNGELSGCKPIGFHQQAHLGARIDELMESWNMVAIRNALWECVDMLSSFKDDPEVAESISIADAALAVPPRNCDKYATNEEAFDAYRADETRPVVGYGTWLFAPAATKGGAA